MTQAATIVRKQHHRARWAVLPLALLTVLATAGPAQAQAPNVTCGSTLTANTVLKADLTCPDGNGIVLATGVTLDLRGHSLVGPGPKVDSVGVTAQGGNTIRSGQIKNWGTGVSTDNQTVAAPATITAVILNHAPSGGGKLKMTWSAAIDSPIESVQGEIAISNSTLTRSGIESFAAPVSVNHSVLIASDFVVEESAPGVINDSYLDGRGTTRLGSCYRNDITITNSTVTNYTFPLNGIACNVTLTGNRFSNMPQGVLGGVGEHSDSLPPAIVKNNTFTKSGVAINPNALVPVILENNTFTQGITGAIIQKSQGSRIVGNTASDNSDTGIKIAPPIPYFSGAVAEVGSNKATNNGGYGIDAPQVTDLGGNVAYGNQLGQCIGVTCGGK